jgi:hypothetical protein
MSVTQGRWRSGYGNGVEEDELSESEDEEMVDGESQVDAEEVDFTWVDEEDYTLVHAWPAGLDPTTGIIYVRFFPSIYSLVYVSDHIFASTIHIPRRFISP